MTKLNLGQQMILAHHGRISTSDPKAMNAYLGTLRGKVAYEKFPGAAAHLAVIEREGEGGLERMRIPAALRIGAILDTYCGGGGKLGSFGVFAVWKRTETDWELVSAERQKFHGRRGHDVGKLKLTPEQIEFRTDQNVREVYADVARRFGERDD
ncbi:MULTISPECIES: hypothetical protein [unclassified Rhizobium]|uniref:hypothetical protein n=1 Tax=unclassified Rhizobium TaxID=2613769 RepID=UPI0007EAF93C|nr:MULTISPECIES: hypothetical protein [unclassified Rhizobium]ANL12046.1 hypothetical protein AMJ98_PA00100 [Rhizobium sp. N1341]ANM42891.1 hypothetical protein AMK03_PA00100 [Rhizobium sp. N741]